MPAAGETARLQAGRTDRRADRRIARLRPDRAGVVVDQIEYLLPLVPGGPGFKHLREHVIESADCVKVADASPVAVDFRADCLLVLRFGVGQPFQKIAELVDAFAGRQTDPVIDGVRRRI